MEGVTAEPSPAAAIAALVRARQHGEQAPGIPSIDLLAPASNQELTHPSRAIASMAVGTDFGGHGSTPRSFVDLSVEVDRPGRTGKAGYIIAGSEDCSIKLYDLDRFDRSVVLSTRDEDQERRSFS